MELTFPVLAGADAFLAVVASLGLLMIIARLWGLVF